MALRSLVVGAATVCLCGCVGPGVDERDTASTHLTRLPAPETSWPLCAPHQLAHQALVRDLTVPFEARVYVTPTGHCVPAATFAPTVAAARPTLEPMYFGAEFETPYDEVVMRVPPIRVLDVEALHRAFAAELAADRLAVIEAPSGEGVRLILRGDAVFRSGSAHLRPSAETLVKRLGWTVAGTGAALIVTGHTDSVPIRRARFASNQALSQARAEAAADVLRALAAPPLEVQAQGRGADEPIASNATRRGRAENRRIEIQVQLTDRPS